MRISLGDFRSMIREELDRCVRNSAGMYGGGMNSAGAPNRGDGPPSLGGPDEEENEEHEEEKELPDQLSARELARTGGLARTPWHH